MRVVVGIAFGERSPVQTTRDTLFVDARSTAGATLPLDAEHEERAIYWSAARSTFPATRFGPDRLLVFRPGDKHHHPRAD